MRLSLNILADWLSAYHPVKSISSSDRSICNVRLYSEYQKTTTHHAYLYEMDAQHPGGIMCMHKNDFIYLQSSDINEVTNKIMEAFDFYNSWQDSLYASLTYLTLPQLLEKIAKILPGFIIVSDLSYYVVGTSKVSEKDVQNVRIQNMLETHTLDISHISETSGNPLLYCRSGHSYRCDLPFVEFQGISYNLFLGDTQFGWISIYTKKVTDGMLDLMDAAAEIVEHWMQLHDKAMEKLNMSGLFADILNGEAVDENRLEACFAVLGCHRPDPKKLYAFHLPPQYDAYPFIRKLNTLSAYICSFIHQSRYFCLCIGEDQKRKAFEQRLTLVLGQYDCFCGSSPVFHDIFFLPQSADMAETALQYAVSKKSSGILTDFSVAGLTYLLNSLKNSVGAAAIHPALFQLQEYDQNNGTDLFDTLKIYLQTERNYAEAARKLFIHRNSMLYRMQRIREFTHLNLDDPSMRLYLLLSYELFYTKTN